MKTVLKDRTLWFDGVNEIPSSSISDFILSGVPVTKIVATTGSDDLDLFNALEEYQIPRSKTDNAKFDLSWNIPVAYKIIDLKAFLLPFATAKGEKYVLRLTEELVEIDKRKLHDLFRTIIFIVDTLKHENKVWGVGRGSSCASLTLFLIGLHQVDPIKFNIDMTEFFHD